MNALVITALSLSAISSATGMILFRYGGRGNTSIAEFFNVYIFLGCIVYMIGAIAALYSLSKFSAAQAYPFTVLHAVILYGHLEKFFSPSRCESDSLTAMGHGRMERASHGADGLFRC